MEIGDESEDAQSWGGREAKDKRVDSTNRQTSFTVNDYFNSHFYA
jgi:hypothetical protein